MYLQYHIDGATAAPATGEWVRVYRPPDGVSADKTHRRQGPQLRNWHLCTSQSRCSNAESTRLARHDALALAAVLIRPRRRSHGIRQVRRRRAACCRPSPRRGRRVSWWARRRRAAHRGRRAGAIVALIGLVAAAPRTASARRRCHGANRPRCRRATHRVGAPALSCRSSASLPPRHAPASSSSLRHAPRSPRRRCHGAHRPRSR